MGDSQVNVDRGGEGDERQLGPVCAEQLRYCQAAQALPPPKQLRPLLAQVLFSSSGPPNQLKPLCELPRLRARRNRGCAAHGNLPHLPRVYNHQALHLALPYASLYCTQHHGHSFHILPHTPSPCSPTVYPPATGPSPSGPSPRPAVRQPVPPPPAPRPHQDPRPRRWFRGRPAVQPPSCCTGTGVLPACAWRPQPAVPW